ncbi:MAG: sigma-E factor regulatory protein RseB domain-containing protein [Dermatophilaceae bacterium]
MSLFTDHPRARWAAPTAALALIGAAAFVTSATATADSGLPPRTAAELLVDLQQAQLTGLSGTVVQTANLGLPQIPGMTGTQGSSAASTSLSSVISGTHTWRVWTAGPTQSRLALVGSAGESDVIRNGQDLWMWSSSDKTAVHYALPEQGARPTPEASSTDLPRTPEEAAQRALAEVDPSTEVTTSGTGSVAGRTAYDLVLKPRDNASRVAQVRIAIDGEQHVPLRVQVYSTEVVEPAVEVGFTAVDFSMPDARQFEFTPPEGTSVTDKGALPLHKPSSAANPAPSTSAEPKVVGTGWTAVAVATLPDDAKASLTQQPAAQLLASVPQVSGAWGSGRLVDGTLFSAVLTDDGRVAVGAVAPERLYAALSAP